MILHRLEWIRRRETKRKTSFEFQSFVFRQFNRPTGNRLQAATVFYHSDRDLFDSISSCNKFVGSSISNFQLQFVERIKFIAASPHNNGVVKYATLIHCESNCTHRFLSMIT